MKDEGLLRNVLNRFNERSKELNCLYEIESLLKMDYGKTIDEIFNQMMPVITNAYQYPAVCEASVDFEGKFFKTEDYNETKWCQESDIVIDGSVLGKIKVVYTQMIREINGSQFLPEEQQLLNTVAERVAMYIFIKRLTNTVAVYRKRHEKMDVHLDSESFLTFKPDIYWKWRMKMAEQIVSKINNKNLKGIVAVYVIGSTKNATAGPASDIDLLLHFRGDECQRKCIELWFEGWSFCLDEMNYQSTGYRSSKGLIDLHIVSDEDIEMQTSFAVKIDAVTDPARLIWKMPDRH